MPEQLNLDSFAAFQADVQRRLQVLEATSRVGLNRVRYAWSTANAEVTSFGVWNSGPAAATWADDRGNTGTGNPSITVTHGKKMLYFAQGDALAIANDATFRTYRWYIGIGLPAGTPAVAPTMWRTQTHGPTTEGNNPLTLVVGRADLVPGSYVYNLQTLWEDNVPAAANKPTLSQAFIAMLPID
jgi:hypothetical protein